MDIDELLARFPSTVSAEVTAAITLPSYRSSISAALGRRGYVPIGALVNPLIVSLAGDPAAIFAAKGQVERLFVRPIAAHTKVLLQFRSLIPSKKAWAISPWMESRGCPTRARCTNCSPAAVTRR